MSAAQDAVMWATFAVILQFFRRFVLCVIVLIPLYAFTRAPSQASTASHTIYFVAGTPTRTSPQTYPVALYTANDRRLKIIRTLVPGNDGLYWVVDDLSGTLAVVYPHVDPTTISIIHQNDPTRSDVVVFNPEHLVVLDYGTAAASDRDNSHALFVAGKPAPNGGPVNTPSVISVSLQPTVAALRVSEGALAEYQNIRVAGVPGGPAFTFVPSAKVIGDGIYAYLDDRHYRILPTWNGTPILEGYIDILAASSRYFAFYPSKNMQELQKVTSRTIFVLDREKNRWKRIIQPGNLSRTRLCGPWLITLKQEERNLPPGQIPALPPDRSDPYEQGESQWMRDQYGNFQGAVSVIPGLLVMDNLEDGRTIVLNTGREDSEILWADDNNLLYRVNDAIYQAQIAGDKIQNPTLVVKDDDVPEIHWVFWSK